MAAAITDLFTQATNGTRPSPTTLTAIHTNGQTTFTVNSLTGWPTATAVHFIVYTIDSTGAKVAGSQTDWKGIGNGTTSIASCVLKAGTDNGYSVGAVVECAPTAAWADDIVSGATAQHTQLGAHTGVTTDTLTATGVVNTSAVSSLQDTSIALSTYRKESQTAFVASGGIWTGDALASTRNASMTALVCHINGRRISIGAVTARSFTASKDTYIDVLDNADGTGTLVYTEVTNNAASPALAANSIRIGIIVTGATTIAAAGSINQGDPTCVLPIASSNAYSVTDSLGNLICNRAASPRVIGYRQIVASVAGTSTTETSVPGLDIMPVIVPYAGARIRLSACINGYNNTGSSNLTYRIKEGATVLQPGKAAPTAANVVVTTTPAVLLFPSVGTHTYTISQQSNVDHANIEAGATEPAYLMAELF